MLVVDTNGLLQSLMRGVGSCMSVHLTYGVTKATKSPSVAMKGRIDIEVSL